MRFFLVLSVLLAWALSAEAHRDDHPRFGSKSGGGGGGVPVATGGSSDATATGGSSSAIATGGSSSSTSKSDSGDNEVLVLSSSIGADACANGAQGGGGGWGLSVSRMAAICELAMQAEEARVAGTEARSFADQHRRTCEKSPDSCDDMASAYWDEQADRYWHARFAIANEIIELHRTENLFWTVVLFGPRVAGKILGALVSF